MRLGMADFSSRSIRRGKLSVLVLVPLITTLGLIMGCQSEVARDDSKTTDIFRQDEGEGNGNSRRHKATGDEVLWTIDMGGCTGHLIAPEFMMTAAHCSPRTGARYTSGAAIAAGGGSDITVTQVVEIDRGLDYAIMKIRWNGEIKKAQKFPPKVATKASDLDMGRGSGQGDEIYTVGFPGDTRRTWGATYAEGRAKEVSGRLLRYNIGIINGNSGGGVWRKSDRMLVSLTNGGPNVLGQGSWRGSDSSDSRHWNHGAAMWNVYAVSPTLQDIFPGGKNRFVDDEAPGETKGLFVALDREERGAADSFKMLIAAPSEAVKVAMCRTAKASDCKDGAEGLVTASKARSLGAIQVYRSNTPADLQDDLVLSFAAYDGEGRLIAGETVRFELQP